MDAPKHVLASEVVATTAATVDKVSLSALFGEACVVDVPDVHKSDRDYLITIDDLKDWERTNGPFHEDCVVLVRTGYEKYWGDLQKYMGGRNGEDVMHLSEQGWPDSLHWPALAPEAAEWLLKNRQIKAIGEDTVSTDAGQHVDWAHSVHTVSVLIVLCSCLYSRLQVILGSGRVMFENLKLSQLPV